MDKHHTLLDRRLELIRDRLTPIPGQFDILRATDRLLFETVLDIGFGRGGACVYFASVGKKVTGLSLTEVGVDYPPEVADQNAPIELMDKLGIRRDGSDFHQFDHGNEAFDAIWAAHILEHTLDCGQFLRKCYRLLTNDGWLLVSVPPFKQQVVMGHVSVGWNLGLLMHALLVTGFNIRDGHFIKHGYNLTAFVKKGNPLVPLIERGASYDELSVKAFQEPLAGAGWPFPIHQGFDGNVDEVNWIW